VIAPAKTGKESNKRTAVIKTAQTNKGVQSSLKPKLRMLRTVVIKLTAPKIEEIPAKCKEKIAVSTASPLCPALEDKGGYTVQPVPTPLSISLLKNNRIKAGIRSQNLILFIRGKAISTLPTMSGTSQLPNPPIIIGITIKKIMTKACPVTITL